MPRGISRRAYAKKWGVDESSIRLAILNGTVILHPDGSVDVEASDAFWGRLHAARLAEEQESQSPEWHAWFDRELAELKRQGDQLQRELDEGTRKQ